MSSSTNVMDRCEATFIVSNDPNPNDRDFTNLQDALNALPPSGGKIFVKAGVYPLVDTIRITSGNIAIQGEGMGITQFVAGSQMTGNTPALQAFNPGFGTACMLQTVANRGSFSISLSPVDTASFTVGDTVLLFSNKEVDSEVAGKHAGEVKRVATVWMSLPGF